LAGAFTKPLQGTLFKSFSNSVFIINDAALNHNKEDRIVLGITHMGVNRTETGMSSAPRKNHITQTLRRTYTIWSFPALDGVNNLCVPGKVIS